MKAKNERYEFSFDGKINNGGKEELNGLAIDVETKGDKQISNDKPQIMIMTEDKGEGHTMLGYIEFENIDNLKLAQMGLELIQEAIGRDIDERN